jgi:hypothetical protein
VFKRRLYFIINLKLITMDHVVYLDAKAKELENLVMGNKTMIIRAAAVRQILHGSVTEGDVLYFINNNGEKEVKARGVVSSVFNYNELSEEESFETIIRNQDKLQLPDEQFEKLAGKSYLILIGLDGIEKVEPFRIKNSNYANTDDWLPVGKIEMVTFKQS